MTNLQRPRTLVLSGYGLNCEEESAHAFRYSGAEADIVHINDLLDAPERLDDYQILMVPGGFSYGDDTGSGNAFANKLRNRLMEPLQRFVARDTLTLGICNGCQILTQLGLVPGLEQAEAGRRVSVIYNSSNRYQCRWVDVAIPADSVAAKSPWLSGIERMHIPVAHGEGNMVMAEDTLEFLGSEGLIALRYVTPEGKAAYGEFPYNPNGAMADIAAVSDKTGRVLAMMPHPERGMFFTQRDDWPLLKAQYQREGKALPEESDGMALFRGAVAYFA